MFDLKLKNILIIITSLIFIILNISRPVHAKFNYKEYKEKPDILIISGNHYKKVVKSLESYLPSRKYDVSVKYISSQEIISEIDKDIDFIISVGRKATLRANEYLSTVDNAVPLLAVLIPKKMYNSINKNIKNNKDPNRLFSAIYREQPVERQLQIIADLIPSAKTIGVLTSMYDPESIEELKKAASKQNFDLIITENYKRENLINSLRYVLSHCDVLLALPDPEIYNPFTAKGILVTSYRRKIPIIGYSKTYVDAGALAAVYSKAESIAKQTGAITNTFFMQNKLPKPDYPAISAVHTNETVIKNLIDNNKNKKT